MNESSPNQPKARFRKFLPIAVGLLVVAGLGFGWKQYTEMRAFQAEVDAANASCTALGNFLGANEDVALEGTSGWSKAATVYAELSPEASNDDPAQTMADCDTALIFAKNAPVERDLAIDLAHVETSAGTAEAEGIDLTPIKVVAKAEDIHDKLVRSKFAEAKADIANLDEEIALQRSLFHQGQADYLIADIAALNALLELNGNAALTAAPIETAKTELMDDFSDENVDKLTIIVRDGAASIVEAIATATTPVAIALTERIDALGKVDLATREPAFTGLKLQVDEVSNSSPVDVATFHIFKSRADKVSTALDTFKADVTERAISAVGNRIIAAKAQGLGAFLPAFDKAELAFSALTSGSTELAEIEPAADAIEASLSVARTEFTQALEKNTELRTDLAIIRSDIEDRGLAAFAPYVEVIGAFVEIDNLNLVEQNEELGTQISDLRTFLDRYQRGEL